MRAIIYICFCLFTLSCTQKKHSANDAVELDHTRSVSKGDSAIGIPKTLTEIKSAYSNTINNLKQNSLQADSVKYNCAGEKSGTITYFTKDGKLILIRHSYHEYDHFSAVDLYFVKDESLYFMYLQETVWSFESGSSAEPTTKDDITESRVYITNNQAIQCLEKKYTIKSKSTNNPIPDQIQNKSVECKNTASLIKNFKNLLAFKSKPKGSCFEK